MLFAAGVSLFTSCKDEDDAFATQDADRLFMPMFRTTTNTASSTTLYHCDIASKVDQYDEVAQYLASKGLKASNHVNDMRLFWYEVDGAVGYELKAKVHGTSWELAENPNLLDTIFVGGDVNTFLHEDLQYGTG